MSCHFICSIDWNDQETEDGDEFDNIRGDDDWFTAEIHNPMKGKGNAINAPNNRVSNTRASAMEDGDDDDFEMVSDMVVHQVPYFTVKCE